VFTQRELLGLVADNNSVCVSIYMPTHPAGPDRRQDEIRLKNLLQQARRQLESQGVPQDEATRILKPLEQLPTESDVWQRRNDGVALFATHDHFYAYTFPLRFVELVVVNSRFYVSPLVPLLLNNGRYFILALTKDSADLYEATKFALTERELPELEPHGPEQRESHLQYHSHRSTGEAKGRSGETIYHGHGGDEEHEKVELTNFFQRQVDSVVCEALKDVKVPLVLACVDYLAGIYRDVNSYPHLVRNHVSGSPTAMDQKTLRTKAWQIAEPELRKVEQQALQQFEALAGTERTVAEEEKALEAARNGRIDTLLVPLDIATATFLRPSKGKGKGELSQRAQLVEEVTEHTLLKGGQVLAVEELPENCKVAAVLRY